MNAIAVVVALCAPVVPAHAESTDNGRAYFAGLVVRTDRATQSTRVSAGLQLGRMRLAIVADPLGYQRSAEQDDTDVLVSIDVIRKWAVMAGWRATATPILGRRYWQHKPFVGVSAPLPSLFWGRVQTSFGVELAVTVAKHGDDLPAMTAWSANWDHPQDVVDVGLFFRAELTRGLR